MSIVQSRNTCCNTQCRTPGLWVYDTCLGTWKPPSEAQMEICNMCNIWTEIYTIEGDQKDVCPEEDQHLKKKCPAKWKFVVNVIVDNLSGLVLETTLTITVQVLIQWGLNIDHLNTRNNWIPNLLKFGFQMVWYSNGWSIGYALCTRPTIWILDRYIRKQNGVRFSNNGLVTQCKTLFETRTN